MPKNKNKPNAFYFFMLDWKKEEEKKGREFPNGLKDVQAESKCNEAWKNLSAEDKAYYKEKQKTNSIQVTIEKKTAVGESLDNVHKAELEEKEFLHNMRQDIHSTILKAYTNNDLRNHKFYVIHINYFYSRYPENSDIEYFPAEIALAEFSLIEGVTRIYEKIIYSAIHTGYASAAIDHCTETHQIPLRPEFGEGDYGILYKEIREFLKPGRINGKLPPLYTLFQSGDVKRPVLSVLQALANFDRSHLESFTVYSFEELFVGIYNTKIKDTDMDMGIRKLDNIIVSINIKKDPFAFKKSLLCEFHSEVGAGGNYCSRSLVQRWIFVMFSFCCPQYYIHLLRGSHKPIENKGSEDDTLADTFQQLNLYQSVSSKTRANRSKQLKSTSERTYKEEQQRRSDSMAQPLVIIDHSVRSYSGPLERPRRPPHTQPGGCPVENPNYLRLDQNNFPAVGRGARRKNEEKKTDFASLFK